MNTLGVKFVGHDAGACLVSDRLGRLEAVAITEARLNRRKHSGGFPLLSIRYCLEAMSLELADIDAIAADILWANKSHVDGIASRSNLDEPDSSSLALLRQREQQLHRLVGRANFHAVNHLDAHAASAFLCSPFDKAAVLVVDGGGVGIYRGENNQIRVIDRVGYGGALIHNGNYVEGRFSLSRSRSGAFNSTGKFYTLLTQKLGLGTFGEGKTMALAAFADRFERQDLLKISNERFFDCLIFYGMATQELAKVEGFDPARHAGGAMGLIDARWVNMARQGQEALERDMLHLAQIARDKTKSSNLCLAGGVALSCVTNRKILNSGLFEKIFIQPAASDEGIPLGAALLVHNALAGTRAKLAMDQAYLGSNCSIEHNPGILSELGLEHAPVAPDHVAERLADGRIVARAAGRSEYGPRALGNRSILADPRRADMARRLNVEVKHREPFRPFAPSVLAHRAGDYFDLSTEAPFMLLAAQATKRAVHEIPAALHVDESSRPQTVRQEQNPDYFALLQAFERRTGVGVVLNTSFNDNGEPIIETSVDALRSYLSMPIDDLILGERHVSRPDRADELARVLDARSREAVQSAYAAAAEWFDAGVHNRVSATEADAH